MRLEKKRNIFLIFVAYVLILTSLSFLTVLFFKIVLHQDIHMLRQRGMQTDIGHSIFYFYMILLAILFHKYWLKLSKKEIGIDFKGQRWIKEVLSGWGLSLSLSIFYSLILVLFHKVTFPESISLERWKFFLIQFPTVFGVAVVEEYVFRGLVFTLFKKAFPLIFSVIISSIIFSYAHFFNQSSLGYSDFLTSIGLFILGCLLCAAYLYKNSLFLPIGFHAGLVTFRLLNRKTHLFSYVQDTLLFGSNNDPRTGIITWGLFLLLLLYFLRKHFQLSKSP